MSRNNINILQHELIGLESSVHKYKNNNFGIIVDETKNTLEIEFNGIVKKFIKNNSIFYMKVNNELLKIKGTYINNRSEDRVKKKNKRNW
ncbi:ribonuclease P protein subunit [Candidatus Bathyarchaeota archaeon]|nr:ribonuclease P protein subunit [Candidatus Bathyarchaeota archaeon]